MSEESDDILKMMDKGEEPPKLRRPKKVVIPRRQPSAVIPPRTIVYRTADKTTCAECTCFPKEEPYSKPKRLLQCQQSPQLLYELAAAAVDRLPRPAALGWCQERVAAWMEYDVGFPEYTSCILDSHIDGKRLLMLEDPSNLPPINIHRFDHIQKITAKVRELFSTDVVRFLRSVGLPPRRPLVHATWFKSRTGPSWGIRKNWTRCDVLRAMQIVMPEPVHRDHWDLVWYQKPDIPSVKFGKIPKTKLASDLQSYGKPDIGIKTLLVNRKFVLSECPPREQQYIWLEPTPYTPINFPEEETKVAVKKRFLIEEDSRLLPRKITTEGLSGKDLILARRKMPKPKFLVMKY